ncbi:MAG: hypothetical protein LBB90_11050, partial [Tannerella sp.]|nr:hypothetical protein [Tannerella sp.]
TTFLIRKLLIKPNGGYAHKSFSFNHATKVAPNFKQCALNDYTERNFPPLRHVYRIQNFNSLPERKGKRRHAITTKRLLCIILCLYSFVFSLKYRVKRGATYQVFQKKRYFCPEKPKGSIVYE